MLEVDKVSASYGDLQVLWDVSLKVEEGELVVLLGPNGAGKTTLLKTIIGLLRPKSGSISFLGRRIDSLSPADIIKLGISIVPEGRRLFPHMTVKENLELGAYASKEARERIKDHLEFVYNLFPILKERENQLAGSFSGGEQQMLAIARALMTKPKLLMLDEPSLGLAPKVVLRVFDVIKKIKEEGITILLVEQNVRQALEIADRGYVLENGRIVLEGSSRDLLKEEHIRKTYLAT